MVLVVTTVCERVFHFRREWFTLFISIIVALIGVSVRALVLPGSTKPTLVDYLIGILNGFLIYTTAVGARNAAGQLIRDGLPRYLNR
jgi:zinc transporter ZupT